MSAPKLQQVTVLLYGRANLAVTTFSPLIADPDYLLWWLPSVPDTLLAARFDSEGSDWARGWDTPAAQALLAAHALENT